MKKLNYFLITLFFISLFFFSCASNNNGAKTGPKAAVYLEGNPTTGYSWVLESQSNKNLKLVNQEYKERLGSQGAVGAGGEFIFDFAATKSGETELTFVYARPWNKNDFATKKSVIAIIDEDLKITYKY